MFTNSREQLQKILEDLSGVNVYFQPPQSIRISYPAIIYSLSNISHTNANNNTYTIDHEYKIVLVDKNPDSKTIEKLMTLPRIRFADQYAKDGLYYNSFYIYYK